jgi:hypothetical protein
MQDLKKNRSQLQSSSKEGGPGGAYAGIGGGWVEGGTAGYGGTGARYRAAVPNMAGTIGNLEGMQQGNCIAQVLSDRIFGLEGLCSNLSEMLFPIPHELSDGDLRLMELAKGTDRGGLVMYNA